MIFSPYPLPQTGTPSSCRFHRTRARRGSGPSSGAEAVRSPPPPRCSSPAGASRHNVSGREIPIHPSPPHSTPVWRGGGNGRRESGMGRWGSEGSVTVGGRGVSTHYGTAALRRWHITAAQQHSNTVEQQRSSAAAQQPSETAKERDISTAAQQHSSTVAQ